ncbi:MFS transporter [Zophobihabitans entericus]|uniref:MFS transporter n=1 Tax=Zophobihabitans entericus TaxID=1635327 RepID=A0A6G9IA90_9GAMM|nr:MFS transporter [Zophobihabitans entericus]QIQ21133.1 MFS transporter [Zophobihabitans entericus]
MKVSNPYGIVGSIYANYIIQSISLIVIMQFSLALSQQLDTDLVGIGYVASGIGIGKILLMFVGGILSDKYGRKPFIFIGMTCYASFYIGMLFCTDIHVAFFLAILVGAGNSFLDTGSMPALTENFPRAAGTASVLIKAFISIGTLILPFIVAFIYSNELWFGWAFMGFLAFLAINALLLLPKKFPSKNTVIAGSASAEGDTNYFIGKPNMFLEGVCLIIMGFTTTATFAIIMQWMPEIAKQAVGMEMTEASKLISYYSIGSIISVFFTAYIVKKHVKPLYCIIILPLLSGLILLMFLFNISPLMCKIVAFGMGFTAAGGVLQLTLVVMQQLFPSRKGFAVGIVYTLSGFSFIVIPLIVPTLALTDVRYVIVLNMLIAFASVLLASIVYFRFKKVIDMKKI